MIVFSSLAQKTKGRPVNKLIGVWQVSNPQLGDAWLSNYRFYSDATFKYTLNQYDDRGRIKDIFGTYQLKANKLILIIKLRHELVGGDITSGSMGFQQEELILDGAKMIEVKQKNQKPLEFVINFPIKKGVKCITIQDNIYYLIDRNPTAQDI